jgi:hypothetical protein
VAMWPGSPKSNNATRSIIIIQNQTGNLKREINRQRQWFLQNRQVMRAVRHQFRSIQDDLKLSTTRKYFVYDDSEAAQEDVENTSWLVTCLFGEQRFVLLSQIYTNRWIGGRRGRL